jgi:mRNA interferase RelE/StbE
MKGYAIRFTREAVKDIKKLAPCEVDKLKDILLNQIARDPLSGKRLVGDLKGFFSVRLSYKDRIVYTVDDEQQVVYVHRARTHYGD